MAIDQESFNTDLYKLLRTRGYKPVPKDAKNQRTQPEAAEVFNFTFTKDGKDYGDAWVTIDDASNVVLYYSNEQEESPSGKSPNLDYDDSWSGLKRHLKQWSMNKQLSFELRNKDELGDDMAQRDYVKKKEKMNEGYHSMGRKASYNDNIPAVKIILQHNRQIEEGEQRYRNIAKIFLENQDGERFLAPTTRPGIAQIYARHIAESGVPNDERWNHIKALCEEYGKMAGFVRATKNKQFNESAQSLVNEGINHYQSLRETLGKLRGHRGYNMYFESWTPALMEDDTDGTQINELFVQETVDPRIESVMPILSRLHKKIGETQVKEVKELEQWADSIVEQGVTEDPTSKLKMGDKVVCDYTGKPAEVSYILGDKAKISIDGVRQPNYRNIENLKKIASEETLEEDSDSSPVESAIIRRIINVRPELLGKHGPEKVLDAVKEVASYVGDVDEIGSSDVSAWIRQVERILSSQEVEEDLDPQQKKAGQLGPTEKIGPEGAVGKLVGACESVTAEEGTPEHKVIWNLINGDLDAYDVMNHPKTPAERNVSYMMQERYDEISSEYPLHADDDFEKILEKLVDELADDYGTSGYSMNEGQEDLDMIKRLVK